MGPSAISLTSQGLKLASQACWMTFAVLTLDLPVVVSALMALTTNALVTTVELARRRDVGLELAAYDRELVGAQV
jgi:hypothetical protein